MKREIFYLGLLLFCFVAGCICSPVQEKIKVVRTVFSYKGHVDTRTTACNESLARWTISGDFIFNSYENFTILQLDKVKTSIFNGPISDLQLAEEKAIPEEAKIYQEPFLLKWGEYNRFELFFKKGEPLWSINMKKSLANIINFVYDKPVEEDGKIKTPSDAQVTYYDNSLYGNCSTSHIMKSASIENGIVYEKKINSFDCSSSPIKHSTKTRRAPGIKDLSDVFDLDHSLTLTLKKIDKIYHPSKFESKSHIVYKNAPSGTYTQNIDQEQTLELLESTESEKTVDFSEYTDKRDLIYEFEDDAYSGRRMHEADSSVLAKQFIDNYDKFEKTFREPLSENYDIRQMNPMDTMWETLEDIDLQGLEEIENLILKREDHDDLVSFYFSLLPYIGSTESVKYLSKFIQTKKVVSDGNSLMKLLALFPNNIWTADDKLLVDLEPLMNIDYLDKHQQSVKNAGVLSFASAVGTACKSNTISKTYKTKYIEMFNNKFLAEQSYETRMVQLLGLVNMAECLDSDFINAITTNTTESSHLRTLALTGFKNYLVENSDKLFEIYWPIVQKKSEPFEVRVAALELLLSVKLSEEQFNAIVNKYSTHLNEPEDKQLANYLLTSLHSLQNTTGYNDNLGAFASEVLKNSNIPRYPKAWATGNYRLSYTDPTPNYGSSLEAHVITDPKSNIINAVHCSFNSFGMTFDFGTYTVYLKFVGWSDFEFAKEFPKIGELSSIPVLIKLLKDFKYDIKTPNKDVHIEIILFVNDVAVYARHFDDFSDAAVKLENNEIEQFFFTTKHISHPVMDYLTIPSDLGTTIQVSNNMMDITKRDIKTNNLKYRTDWSYQTWLGAYNPLVDTNIANYKYYISKKDINVNMTVKKDFAITLAWTNSNNTYNEVWDSMMGTMVENKNILKEYCPKCDAYNELPTDIYSSWTNVTDLFTDYVYSVRTMLDFAPFGISCRIARESNVSLDSNRKIFYKFASEKLHHSNIDAFPYVGPILYLANNLNYKFWLGSELAKGSIRSESTLDYDEPTETVVYFNGRGTQSRKLGDYGTSNLNTVVEVKSLDDGEVLSSACLSASISWDPKYESEDGVKSQHFTNSFNINYTVPYYNQTRKFSGYGELDLPAIMADKLSIKLLESATGNITVIDGCNTEDEEDCIVNKEHEFSFVYTARNIESILLDKQLHKYLEKCMSDSKDLKFTAPTEECKIISSKLTNYDDLKVHLKTVIYEEDNNKTIDMEYPVFEYSHDGRDTLNLAIMNFLEPGKSMDERYWNFTIYYPKKTVNPLALAYKEDSEIIPIILHNECTISPSTIEQFSKKYIPNQKEEWFAFGECYNVSRRALIGHTIGDKNVGFTFYSDESIVTGTIKNGKAEFTINGKPLTKYYIADDSYLKVQFLADNVIVISDSWVQIYYNTEYVSIRAEFTYPKLLCGMCTEEH